MCCLEVLPLRPFTVFFFFVVVYCRMGSRPDFGSVARIKRKKAKKMEKESGTRRPSISA